MFSLGRLRLVQSPTRYDQVLGHASPLILTGIVAFFIVHGLALIQLSNGGSDLVQADIPKSLMLLSGQNPYSTSPWASPYPPLLLLVDSGIIRLTGLFNSGNSLDLISQNLRTFGLFADTIVAVTIYLYTRNRTANPATPLLFAGLFLTLPALSISPLYFFHSDTFGYPILALSLVALASHRYLIGTTLLATTAIYKIHPILALPLILAWIIRTKNLRTAIPSIASTTAILSLGLLIPLAIPGYSSSVLGFNLTNDGNGTTLTSMIGLANNLLPRQLQLAPTTLSADQVWIAATLALFTIILGTVWSRSSRLQPVDIVLLGLLAWLIPLKIEYTHYLAWAVIPVLMRGRLRQTIPLLGLLQAADTLSYWSWFPSTSPIAGIDSFYGLLATSAIYRIIGLGALGFVVYSTRNRKPARSLEDSTVSSMEDIGESQRGVEAPVITRY